MSNEFPVITDTFALGQEATYEEAYNNVWAKLDNALLSVPSASAIETVTLNNNKITPTKSLVSVQVGTGASNQLNYIDYSNLRDGAIINLHIADNNNAITIVNGAQGTGAIQTTDGQNIVLNDFRIILQFQREGTLWKQVGYSSVTTDNQTIQSASNRQLRAIGVINNRDNTTAIKTWVGTKVQYNAIYSKDSNTQYTITDTGELYLGSTLISNKKSAFNLLDFKWSDHLLNDQSWLHADMFSWQDGTVYSNAYQHLVADISGKVLQSETIGVVTVQFYLANDGHKICPASEESNVARIYTNTGVAWYYILDTTNTRFKLPRTKYGFNGVRDTVGRDTVGNYIPESLPNIKGVIGCSRTLHEYNKQPISSGAIIATPSSQTVIGSDKYSSDVYTYSLDANNYSGVYQDNAPVQERATQMYLYFYVGQFSQSATEQTAGITTEQLNAKLDKDRIVFVTEAPESYQEDVLYFIYEETV